MTVRSKAELKKLFETGDVPDAAAFSDLIDSMLSATFEDWPDTLPQSNGSQLIGIEAPSVIDEWIDVPQTVGFVDPDTVILSTNLVSTFPVGRRVRISLSGGFVYSEVASRSYDGGTNLTTVNLMQAVADNTLTKIEVGIFTPVSAGGAAGLGLLGASPFMATFLDDVTAEDARLTLGVAGAEKIVGGRLSTVNGAHDQRRVNNTVVYYNPHTGTDVGVYDPVLGAWKLTAIGAASLSIAGLTDNKLFDIFGYDNAGELTLEGVSWTNDTTRATALTEFEGILLKSGDNAKRYLGTARKRSGVVEMSGARIELWNLYNQIPISAQVFDATNTWTQANGTWRQANNNAANQIDFVLGIDDATRISAFVAGRAVSSLSTARFVAVNIGVDSITTGSSFPQLVIPARCNDSFSGQPFAMLRDYANSLAAGQHYIAWLERGDGTDTQTWQGDGGLTADNQSTGLQVTILA